MGHLHCHGCHPEYTLHVEVGKGREGFVLLEVLDAPNGSGKQVLGVVAGKNLRTHHVSQASRGFIRGQALSRW